MAVIAKQRYKLDIAPKGGWVIVYASQHDNGAREIEFEITNQGNAYSIPASINISVQGVKSNKGYFSHSCSYSGNIVKMALANDMTDVIGKAICVLKFTNSSQQKLATAKFILNVDSDSSSEGVIIDTEAEEIFNQMLNEIRAQAASVSADIAELQSMVGSPLVASTASGMTDHNKIYVYTGSESGYTNGNWYYWNGSAWTSGGVYNSTAINIDSVPIQGSNNAVRSGGVYDVVAGIEDDLSTKAITPITVDNTNFAVRLSDDMIITMFNELPNYYKIEGMSIANGKLGVSSAFNCILFQSPYDGFAFDITSTIGDVYVLNNFPEGNAGETLDIKNTIVGTAIGTTGNLRFIIPDKYSIIIFKFNASYVERMRTAIAGKFKMEKLELIPIQDSFIRYAHTNESTNILPFTLNKEDGKLINASNGGLSTNASYDTYWFKVPVSEMSITCNNGFRAVLTSLPPTDITANGYLDSVIYTYASGRVETFTAKYGQYVGISVGSSTDISLKTDLVKTFTLPTLQLDYGQKGQFYRIVKSGSATYIYIYFASGEKIVGYQLHNVPASGSNSNTWQLGHIMGYDFDGVNVSNGVELVGGGEFELAFKEFGSADYCGGNNHGDENTIDFVLLIDGKQIDLANVDTDIHSFDRIDAVEHAYVNRCDTPNDNILKHQKIWIFENGKVKVKQTLEFLQGLNCDFLCCMFAANRTSFTAGVRQGAVGTEVMADASFTKKSTSGNEMMYLMYGADVSAKITAKTCAHTPEASLWINPATALNKLYYNFYGQMPNTAVEDGTIVWWEQEYEVAYT